MTNMNEPLVLFNELEIVGLMFHSNNKEMIKEKAKQILGELLKSINTNYKWRDYITENGSFLNLI